jgi:hypothetical protein
MDNLYAKLKVTLCYMFMVVEVGSLDTNLGIILSYVPKWHMVDIQA